MSTPLPSNPAASSSYGRRKRKPKFTAATLLLVLLILSISLSPRIRLGGDALEADIRFQDILLVPSIIYLMLVSPTKLRPPIRSLMTWLPTFAIGSVLLVGLAMLAEPDISWIRRVAFYGRTLELLALAAVIAGLYLRSGPTPMAHVLRAIHFGAVANLAWVFYQYSTGTRETLLGTEVSDSIESYGPKLIGEGSAFGTGQYFAFIAAICLAQLRTRGVDKRQKFFALILFAAACFATHLSDSRISLGAIIVMVAILLVVSNHPRVLLNTFGTMVGIALMVAAYRLVVPQLEGRASIDGIDSSFGFRVDSIWAPLMDVLWGNPLMGIGPGGLVDPLPVEAHNILLRAVLDYGIIVGLIFIALFIQAMNRAYRIAKTPKASVVMRFSANAAFLSIISILVSGTVQDALTAVTSSHLTMLAIGLFAAVNAREMRRMADESKEQRQASS